MDKKRQFIFVMNDESPLTKYNFLDLLQDDRVIVLNGWTHKTGNRFLKFLKRAHFSYRLNKVIRLPFKSIWGYTLKDIDWNDDTRYYIIAVGFAPMDIEYLKRIRREHNVRYILFTQDAWDDLNYAENNRYYEEKLHFDLIITLDNTDADKYGFLYSDHHYSMLTDNKSEKTDYDLYFIGINKGRYNKLLNIFQYLDAHGVSTCYRIADVPASEQEYQDKIVYTSYRDRVSYPDVVKGIKAANCILEVLIDVQTGASLRYYEAVCYNKKLLTNNKNVVNLPFYDPDYIHIFEKTEDIDWEWVKKRVPVDYHYDGRFSPTHLIDQIIGFEEEEKRGSDGKKEAP